MTRHAVGYVPVILLYCVFTCSIFGTCEVIYRLPKMHHLKKRGIQFNSIQFTASSIESIKSQNLMCFRIFELSLFKIHLIASSGHVRMWLNENWIVNQIRTTDKISVSDNNQQSNCSEVRDERFRFRCPSYIVCGPQSQQMSSTFYCMSICVPESIE